jgi:hypothetical protein
MKITTEQFTVDLRGSAGRKAQPVDGARPILLRFSGLHQIRLHLGALRVHGPAAQEYISPRDMTTRHATGGAKEDHHEQSRSL